MKRFSMGRHLLFEVYNVNFDLLNDETKLLKVVHSAIIRAGMTILNSYSHQFSPQGVTIVIALSESHFSLHTWPEEGCIALDVYTCGNNNPKIIAIQLLKHLNSTDYTFKEIYR